MPLISFEKVDCFCDFDRGQTDLVDVCKVVLQYITCMCTGDKNLPNLKVTVCATFKSLKCQNFLWSWWPWRQGQGQTDDLQWKVLSFCVLGVNIKFVSKMITDIWTFFCSIGYKGKLNFDP